MNGSMTLKGLQKLEVSLVVKSVPTCMVLGSVSSTEQQVEKYILNSYSGFVFSYDHQILGSNKKVSTKIFVATTFPSASY